jgi:hypothetical protein
MTYFFGFSYYIMPGVFNVWDWFKRQIYGRPWVRRNGWRFVDVFIRFIVLGCRARGQAIFGALWVRCVFGGNLVTVQNQSGGWLVKSGAGLRWWVKQFILP